MLNCIRAIKKVKKDSMEMAYQDSVMALMGCDHDDYVIGQEDDEDEVSDPPRSPEEHEYVL